MKDLKTTFEEAIRCRDDICYFVQTYVVDFKLNERQISRLKNLASGNDSTYEECVVPVVKAYRNGQIIQS